MLLLNPFTLMKILFLKNLLCNTTTTLSCRLTCHMFALSAIRELLVDNTVIFSKANIIFSKANCQNIKILEAFHIKLK